MTKRYYIPSYRISRQGLLWHFQHIIDNARAMVNHAEFQLTDTVDMDGRPHRECALAIAANMKQHLEAMQAFIQEQER